MSLTSPVTTHLFFVYYSGQLAAWSVSLPKAINHLMLSGEEILKINSEHGLIEGSKDAFARLRSNGEKADLVHWVISNQEQESLLKSKLLNQDTDQETFNWQVISWEWVSDRLGIDQSPWQNVALLESQVFPWLATANKANERKKMQDALNSEHQTKAGVLVEERASLEQQNELLRSQNAALQSVDTENLVRFLPALFPRVFTVLGAVDLALLCGRVEPLAIRNPYPEPSEETLHVLQKDFRNLPKHLQKQIVALVARLPQRKDLRPRAEMRNLVTELEES
ncbi:MAG: hypothetical protein GX029_12415 [Pseudomonadaceae bacterium]|nr:hypothetical protein [Pseudomonadaceae bacterium]